MKNNLHRSVSTIRYLRVSKAFVGPLPCILLIWLAGLVTSPLLHAAGGVDDRRSTTSIYVIKATTDVTKRQNWGNAYDYFWGYTQGTLNAQGVLQYPNSGTSWQFFDLNDSAGRTGEQRLYAFVAAARQAYIHESYYETVLFPPWISAQKIEHYETGSSARTAWKITVAPPAPDYSKLLLDYFLNTSSITDSAIEQYFSALRHYALSEGALPSQAAAELANVSNGIITMRSWPQQGTLPGSQEGVRTQLDSIKNSRDIIAAALSGNLDTALKLGLGNFLTELNEKLNTLRRRVSAPPESTGIPAGFRIESSVMKSAMQSDYIDVPPDATALNLIITQPGLSNPSAQQIEAYIERDKTPTTSSTHKIPSPHVVSISLNDPIAYKKLWPGSRIYVGIRGLPANTLSAPYVMHVNDFTLIASTGLAAPTGLSASQGTYSDRVQLTWQKPPTSTLTRVYRALSDRTMASAVFLGYSMGTQFSDTTAILGSTYKYYVQSVAHGKLSSRVGGVEGYLKPPSPTRVLNLTGNLNFGSVSWNTISQRTLTIRNTGNSALTVTSISFPPGFSGNWSGTISAGGEQPVAITFAPKESKAYSGTITVNSNKTSGTATLACSGTGVTPDPSTLANLVDIALLLSPGEYRAGESMGVTHTIFNEGNAASGAFSVRYVLQGVGLRFELGETRVNNLDSVADLEFTRQFTLPVRTPPGEYTLSWYIDSRDEVYESDEDDNAWYRLARLVLLPTTQCVSPNVLYASRSGKRGARLAWSGGLNASTYVVERLQSGSTYWQTRAALGGYMQSHTDRGLKKKTRYYYRVRAAGAGGFSNHSTPVATVKTGR